MICDEATARNKWCPMVRHTPDIAGSLFYTTNGQAAKGFQTCIASDCMMWVWELKKEGKKWVESNKGYCGLAGG